MTQLHLSATFMHRLGWVLVHSVWEFAFIALAAMVLERVMRRCSSAARYWALLLALGAMTVAPAATWLAIPHESTIAVVSAASNASAGRRGQADVSGTGESERDSTPRLSITSMPLPQQAPEAIAESPAAAAATPVESAQPVEQTPMGAKYSLSAWWSWIEQ